MHSRHLLIALAGPVLLVGGRQAGRVERVMPRTRFGIGETFDFAFTPDVAGPMRFEVRQGLLTPSPPLVATMSISVLAAEAKPRSP